MTPIAASTNHLELGPVKMKSYSQFIQESSLTRIAAKSDKGGVGYVTTGDMQTRIKSKTFTYG